MAGAQTGKQAQSDLGFAEAIAFPLLAILAFFIFRGIAALQRLGLAQAENPRAPGPPVPARHHDTKPEKRR